MRLADLVLRQGHLSEDALVGVWHSGERPAHLDRCDICTDRLTELCRWMEDVGTLGHEVAEAAFPDERLVAQRGQILQRLAFLDRPAKVISFPARASHMLEAGTTRGVSPVWLAAAAVAGLALGVFSGELRHTLWSDTGTTQSAAATVSAPAPYAELEASPLYDDPYAQPEFGPAAGAIAEMTPRLIDVVVNR